MSVFREKAVSAAVSAAVTAAVSEAVISVAEVVQDVLMVVAMVVMNGEPAQVRKRKERRNWACTVSALFQ